jgi:hypothetical protein
VRSDEQHWAWRVISTVLRDIMSHEDIITAIKFYVGQNAEATADALWAAHVDTLVDTPERNENGGRKTTDKTSTGERT